MRGRSRACRLAPAGHVLEEYAERCRRSERNAPEPRRRAAAAVRPRGKGQPERQRAAPTGPGNRCIEHAFHVAPVTQRSRHGERDVPLGDDRVRRRRDALGRKAAPAYAKLSSECDAARKPPLPWIAASAGAIWPERAAATPARPRSAARPSAAPGEPPPGGLSAGTAVGAGAAAAAGTGALAAGTPSCSGVMAIATPSAAARAPRAAPAAAFGRVTAREPCAVATDGRTAVAAVDRVWTVEAARVTPVRVARTTGRAGAVPRLDGRTAGSATAALRAWVTPRVVVVARFVAGARAVVAGFTTAVVVCAADCASGFVAAATFVTLRAGSVATLATAWVAGLVAAVTVAAAWVTGLAAAVTVAAAWVTGLAAAVTVAAAWVTGLAAAVTVATAWVTGSAVVVTVAAVVWTGWVAFATGALVSGLVAVVTDWTTSVTGLGASVPAGAGVVTAWLTVPTVCVSGSSGPSASAVPPAMKIESATVAGIADARRRLGRRRACVSRVFISALSPSECRQVPLRACDKPLGDRCHPFPGKMWASVHAAHAPRHCGVEGRMTTPWAILLLCCMAAGIVAFSAARLARDAFEQPSAPEGAPRRPPAAAAVPMRSSAVESPPERSRRLPVPPPPAYATPAPEPTAPQPDSRLLELWAVQVEEGARKMTVATDGCRVTWNRRCKHGHPAWIVALNYLSPEGA